MTKKKDEELTAEEFNKALGAEIKALESKLVELKGSYKSIVGAKQATLQECNTANHRKDK